MPREHLQDSRADAGRLDFNTQADALRQRFEDFIQRRQREALDAPRALLRLLESEPRNRPAAKVEVVVDDDSAVPGPVDVELDPFRPAPNARQEPGHGILPPAGLAAVGDDERALHRERSGTDILACPERSPRVCPARAVILRALCAPRRRAPRSAGGARAGAATGRAWRLRRRPPANRSARSRPSGTRPLPAPPPNRRTRARRAPRPAGRC